MLIFINTQIVFTQDSKYYKVFNVDNCQYHDSSNCTINKDKKLINVGGTFKFDCNRTGKPIIKNGFVEISRVSYDVFGKTYKYDNNKQIDEYDIEYGYRQRDIIRLKYIKNFSSTALNSYHSSCDIIYIKDAYIDSITLNDILKIQSIPKFKDVSIRFDNCYIDNIKLGEFSFDKTNKDTISLNDIHFISCYIQESQIQNIFFKTHFDFSSCNFYDFNISDCIFKKSFWFTMYETRENNFLPYYGVINNNDKISFFKNKNDISIFKSSFYEKVDLIFSDSLYNYNFTENNLLEEKQPFSLTNDGLTSNLNLSLNKCDRVIHFWGTFNNCNIHDIHTSEPLEFDNVKFMNSTIARIYTDIPIEIRNSHFSETVELGSIITSKNEAKFIVENNFSSFNFSDLENIFFDAQNFIYKTTVTNDGYDSIYLDEDFHFFLDNFFTKYEDHVLNRYADKNPNKMDAVLAHMNYNKEFIIYEYCKETKSWWYYWYFLKKLFINFGYNGIRNLLVISILIITLFASIYFYKFKNHLVEYLNQERKGSNDDIDITVTEITSIQAKFKNLKAVCQFLKIKVCPFKPCIFFNFKESKEYIISLRITKYFSKIKEFWLIKVVFFIFGIILEIVLFILSPVCFLSNVFRSAQAKNVVLCMWFSFRAFIDIRFPIKYFKFENRSLFYVILIEWLIGIFMIYVLVSNFYYKIPLLNSVIGV